MKSLICLLILAMMLSGCTRIKMPAYTVLDEEVYDIPIKTQVKLEILVWGLITERGLKALLNKLYLSISERTGFKYNAHPTHISIYAYVSEEHYKSRSGEWIAMLAQGFNGLKPEIEINKAKLVELTTPEAKP